MEVKEKVLEMYEDATRRLDKALDDMAHTGGGSFERETFERIYGERQAYGRVLKELCGVKMTDLQKILDMHHGRKRVQE